MPLSSEQVYNDLTGADVKEILLIRFADLLNKVSEFRPQLTLPRVRMSLILHLDIVGRNPPSLALADELIVRMHDQRVYREGESEIPAVPVSHDLEAVINTNPDLPGEYQPPDQVRVEHGLPIMTPQRGPLGMEDVPIVREGVKYAFHVTQDYGPARARTGAEGPILGSEAISIKNQGGGYSSVKPDFNRVHDPKFRDTYDDLDANGQLAPKG
jgi:hypothetical protein